MSTTLAISHNLFLTKQERYDWYDGKEIEIPGVSVPVWFSGGISSEPAIEVFTTYKLFNRQEKILIHHNAIGYEIIVPKTPLIPFEKLPDEMWESLSKTEQELWYENNEQSPSIINLLDVKDGGSEWLAFRQYGKVNKNKTILNFVHFVEIKPIEELLNSLNE